MKTCLKCLVEKPKSDFQHSQGNADGLNNYCKTCAKTHDHNELVWLGTKVCTQCDQEKARTDFSPNRSRPKWKINPWCKDCARHHRITMYHSDLDVSRKKNRQWAKSHRERKPWMHQPWKDPAKRDKFRQWASDYRKGLYQKDRLEITDRYVRHIMSKETGLKFSELNNIPNIAGIIEAKRSIIQLNRLTKNSKHLTDLI